MDTQSTILESYYNQHLKQNDIAIMLGISKQYVSKIIKADNRYKTEKETRRNANAEKRKVYMQDYLKNYTRPKKKDNSYEQLQSLLYQDSLELSYSHSNMNDYTFAKYNSSIYHRDKNGNLRLNKDIKVGSDVPKTINMNIKVPTQKYKNRCCISR